jgi:phosphomannomutase
MLSDQRSSRVVPETLRARGAVPIRSRVGHAFMKAVMRERGACFGGELSGHYYFRFPSGYIADDGAAAMMLLLEALDARKPPLSKLWRPYQRYRQSGEINRRVADVPAALARVRAAHPNGVADELDGLSVNYPDWWFNLRPSNTEPLLRLNLEASSDAEVASKCAARVDRASECSRGRVCGVLRFPAWRCCAAAVALALGGAAVARESGGLRARDLGLRREPRRARGAARTRARSR